MTVTDNGGLGTKVEYANACSVRESAGARTLGRVHATHVCEDTGLFCPAISDSMERMKGIVVGHEWHAHIKAMWKKRVRLAKKEKRPFPLKSAIANQK